MTEISPEDQQKLIKAQALGGDLQNKEALAQALGGDLQNKEALAQALLPLTEVATPPSYGAIIEEKLSEIIEILATLLTIQEEQAETISLISDAISK